MPYSKSLFTLFISSGLSYAATLSVYQDKTFYNYAPNSQFIGLTQHVTAKCEGNAIDISPMLDCSSEQRLCKEVDTLEALVKKQNLIAYNIGLLEKFVSLPQPQSINAPEWIEAAKVLAEEKATLLSRQKDIKKERKISEERLKKQAPTTQALQTVDVCKSDLELNMPYGYVSFSTSYEANIEDNDITVTQNLGIVNKSGIDIEADKAMFYYRRANPYVRAVHFSPWIVRKYEPRKNRMYKKANVSAAPRMEVSMAEDSAAGAHVMSAPVVSYEDAREYKITNLSLPSTGVALEVQVQTWKSALDCDIKVYPYLNTKAFHICSFEPKYQIDANSWKIKSGTEVINEHATGEYTDGRYNLYTKIEEDIKIVRTPIVKKERETGIFGGTARKKDGFTLAVTNKSDKVKTLTVVERIPTSITEEIKSKLLSVNSKTKIEYKLLKDGKIEMHLTVAANETKKIEVLFEISYDKDVKVSY